ncbi:SDR family NAD(P)-dependent oxidoreductase [Ferruginibacter sp. HRS2-29]|uniref:SDR family NAD(P)-dependent oxidoreductase n=1 Tax=Ferruginibacter sp. HRS2-29 TaxID=2487334 RepID=UPI0020CB9759|nr:glucose 1-dehydrogenase [Ferruginibacter sp. HRS2-29]MCP9749461.1 glucose 1-dehydrogenase [Ferruginibacter sp. HRS2-29]
MSSMTGKVAIVTGGARDIGRQVSIKLAQQGAKVCINYFGNKELAEETLDIITDAGGEAIIVQGDMTKAADVKAVVEACTTVFGDKVHILVNVAGGILGRKPLAELDEEFWDAVMDVNLKSAYLVTRATVPFMTEGGAIVNFASQAARDGGGGGALAYATAKGGVLTMTRGLAKELGPKGIRVNCVSPGMINTTFHDTFTRPEIRTNVAAATPLRREGNAAEVGDLVVYLAGDASSFINGESVEINGGTYFA